MTQHGTIGKSAVCFSSRFRLIIVEGKNLLLSQTRTIARGVFKLPDIDIRSCFYLILSLNEADEQAKHPPSIQRFDLSVGKRVRD